jgi:uncharacterized delta-60 repeat protein
MKKNLLPVFIFLVHVFATTAQPGTLDNTFGAGGKIVTNHGYPESNSSNIALQSDGKIVMAGYAENTTSNGDIILARFNTNGSLDNTFDGDGKVTTDVTSNSFDVAAKVIVLSSGKILVAATSYTNTGSLAVLLQYNSNGTLDNTFDGDGKVTLTVADLNSISDMVIQSDNKIVLAGNAVGDFVLIRFGSTGVPDNTFGTNGVAVPDLGTEEYEATAMAIQADNKVVVAGNFFDLNTFEFRSAVVRYNTNGTLDNTFDTDGKTTIDFSVDDFEITTDISIQSNGNILLSGYAISFFSNISISFVARFTSTGAPDNSFDADGKLTIAATTRFIGPGSHLIQSDGKILLAGAYKPVGGNYDFAVMRLTGSGAVDNTFDGDGIAVSPANTGQEICFDILLQTDNKILLGGVASENNTSMAGSVIRFNAAGTIDNSFDTDGYNTVSFGNYPGYDEAKVVKVQADGKVVVAGNYYPNSLGGFFVARYNSNGTPDNTFGTNGKVFRIVPIECEINSMQIQTDGKIVLTGTQYDAFDGVDILVCRLNTNGTADNTFGTTNGTVTTDIVGRYDLGLSTAIQTDGKIVVTANTADANATEHIALRYNTNGVLDNTFGSLGVAQTGLSTENYSEAYNHTQTIALQTDGKIVLVGPKLNADEDFAIRRYNTNGTPDNTFNGGNVLSTTFDFGDDIPYAVIVQPDGKILVAGEAFDGANSKIALVRYTTTGGLDNTFDGDGKAIILTLANNHRANSLALMSDGKIVVGGLYSFVFGPDEFTYMLAARLNPNGTTENSFGTLGLAIVDDAVKPKFDFANSMAMQTDGKIILAGSTEVNFQSDMAVYRLNGSFPTRVTSPNSPLHLITVAPNPVADKIFLNADGLPNGRYQYKITTLDGKLLASDFINVVNRQIQQYIPATAWPKGTLVFSISNNSDTKSFKLIKQ